MLILENDELKSISRKEFLKRQKMNIRLEMILLKPEGCFYRLWDIVGCSREDRIYADKNYR